MAPVVLDDLAGDGEPELVERGVVGRPDVAHRDPDGAVVRELVGLVRDS